MHSRYVTHLFAGHQMPADQMVYDISGAQGHARRESDLSAADLWTQAGYFATREPLPSNPRSKLQMPALNFDWAGGDSLFLWWLGKATAKSVSTTLLGDCSGAVDEGGIRLRVAPSGALVVVMSGGADFTFTSSSLRPCDGALHSVGLWLDGDAGRGYTWVDETIQVGGNYPPITLNTLPTAPQIAAGADALRIGGDTSTTGAAASGMATATRALVILKLPAGDAVPTVAQVFAAQQRLRCAPHMPLTEDAL